MWLSRLTHTIIADDLVTRDGWPTSWLEALLAGQAVDPPAFGEAAAQLVQPLLHRSRYQEVLSSGP